MALLDWLCTNVDFQLCIYRNIIRFFLCVCLPTGDQYWTWEFSVVTNGILLNYGQIPQMSNGHLNGWVWGEGGLFCTMWLWFIAMQYISNCFWCFKPTVLGYNLSVERIAEVGTALVSPKSPHRFKAMPMPYSVGHCQPLTSANGMKRTNCIAVVHPCIWLKPRCDQLFFFLYIESIWWLQKKPSLGVSRI